MYLKVLDTIDGMRYFRGKFMISGHDGQMMNKSSKIICYYF